MKGQVMKEKRMEENKTSNEGENEIFFERNRNK